MAASWSVVSSPILAGSSLEADFAWAPAHPVVEAYRAMQSQIHQVPGQAMAAVLYAANQKEGYFKLSEPGTIEVLGDGRTVFAPSATGKHRYLIADAAQNGMAGNCRRQLRRRHDAINWF